MCIGGCMSGTKEGEYRRTCEMLVDLAEERGVYFAVALLFDIGYSRKDIENILPILQETKGAIKNMKGGYYGFS